ncbi:expressed unknown protein [Seminavis robusta]|uniref:Uncharacterized protein n=1 Tax=Seminavis robusta TaxID=568900 RepID=A0A9N8D882_9STRA|nr:expressed unknown protein [Seminavis robusta]|eukprot:Sro32_g020940.1 n/a (133) ;mRNA; f:116471-116869
MRQSKVYDDDASTYSKSLYAKRHSLMGCQSDRPAEDSRKRQSLPSSTKISNPATSKRRSSTYDKPSKSRRSSEMTNDTLIKMPKLKNPFKKLRRRHSMNDASKSRHYYGDGESFFCESMAMFLFFHCTFNRG